MVESVFSAVKRGLSAREPGRTLAMQKRQALLLGLAFNIYRLLVSEKKAGDVNRAA